MSTITKTTCLVLEMLAVILAIFLPTDALADDKTTPVLDISTIAYGGDGQPATYFSDEKFEEPVVRVYADKEKTQDITNRFYINYSISGGVLRPIMVAMYPSATLPAQASACAMVK